MRFAGDPNLDDTGGYNGYRSTYVDPPIVIQDIQPAQPDVLDKVLVNNPPISLPPVMAPTVVMSSTQPPVNPSSSAVGAAMLADGIDPAISDSNFRSMTIPYRGVADYWGVGDTAPVAAVGPLPEPTITLPPAPVPTVSYVMVGPSSTMGEVGTTDLFPLDPEIPARRIGPINNRFNIDRFGILTDDSALAMPSLATDPVNAGTQTSEVPVKIPFVTQLMDALEVATLPAQPVQPSVNENTTGIIRVPPITGGGGDSGKQANQVGGLDDSVQRNYAMPTNKNLIDASVNRNTGSSIVNPPSQRNAIVPTVQKGIMDFASTVLAVPDSILGTNGFVGNTSAITNTTQVQTTTPPPTHQANSVTAPNAVAISNTTNAQKLGIALIIGVVIAIIAHFALKAIGEK